MSPTLWYVETDPDLWDDEPKDSAIAAANHYLEWSQDCETRRDELIRRGITKIKVHGYIETNEELDPESAFNGYEPGCIWFKKTGEVAEVIIERVSRLSALVPPNTTISGLPPEQAIDGKIPEKK